jgi:hypothetical protein
MLKNFLEYLKDKLKQIKLMSTIISKPEAFPLRERFSRETTNFTGKLVTFTEFLQKVIFSRLNKLPDAKLRRVIGPIVHLSIA